MNRQYFSLQFWALSGSLVAMILFFAIAASTQTPKRNVMKQMDRATIDGVELEYTHDGGRSGDILRSSSALHFPLNKRSPARFGQIEV